jgi:glycosyltransferase involved in cell wall biosynthesis
MTPLERFKEAVRPYYLRWLYFPLFPHRRPLHFSACWNYPRVDALPSNGLSPGVLFYPMNDWHGRLQRGQQLARAFARQGRNVVYLNPHFGRQFPSVPLGAPRRQLRRLEENVFELHPRLLREPVFHHRLLSAGESREIASLIERSMAAGGWVQLVSYPTWFDAARELRERHGWPIVYDCHDRLRGFGNVAPEIVDREALCLRDADLAVFSADGLMREFVAADPSLAGKTLLLRNAVDIEAFSGVEPTAAEAAVYLGALEHWFDIEAIAEAARCNTGCRFLLGGRVDAPEIRRLGELPNVEFLGEVAYALAPETMARGRIGLIPFRVNELTLATNPIKLYEYFSLGMPVVSVPLPEVEAFGDLVYIGRGPTGFAAAVRQALAEADPARRNRRREIAARESWAVRARTLGDAFQAL